jgi:hypothetical protein
MQPRDEFLELCKFRFRGERGEMAALRKEFQVRGRKFAEAGAAAGRQYIPELPRHLIKTAVNTVEKKGLLAAVQADDVEIAAYI